MTSPRQSIREILHALGIVNVRGQYEFIKRRGLKYRSIFPYEGIPGWLTEDEAITLYELARQAPDNAAVAVEIGSWQGKSSLVLAKGLKGKTKPTLYCIDPFNGDAGASDRVIYSRALSTMNKSLKEAFLDNMRRHGVLDVVHPLEGYSFEFAAGFKDPIDLLFIDGAHEYDAVLQDYDQWSPLLRPGGMIAFHDVVTEDNPDPEGPIKVARQHIFDNPRWTDVKLVDALLVARKTS
jgi:predicted O-methyltransferase YrrM